jgi:NTP pyrophosphatase (non-canonical NTP hydrolase)
MKQPDGTLTFASSSTDENGAQTCHFNENGWCLEHKGRLENYCSEHAHHLNALAARVHKANEKWWVNLDTGERLKRNVGELLMLSVSELAEAMEGHRKNLNDDKLPHRKMFEVEIADCLIRLLDIAGGMGLDLGAAFEEKMAYNSVRVDHTIEARKAADGKKY